MTYLQYSFIGAYITTFPFIKAKYNDSIFFHLQAFYTKVYLKIQKYADRNFQCQLAIQNSTNVSPVFAVSVLSDKN